MSLSAVDKQGWLRGIQFAQDSHVTAPHQQQQQLMVVFFSDGRQLILSYFSYPKLYTQSLNRALDIVLHCSDFDSDTLTRSTVVRSSGW
jgi:hypothetical protein